MTAEKKVAQHSPGPWEIDSIDNEGEYGNDGPDTRSGFKSWVVFDAKGKALFDTLNSDVAEVVEEYDEDGGCAFDEVGLANARLAAAAPDLLSLLTDWVNDFADCLEGGEANELVVFTRAAIAKATGAA